MNDAMDPVLQLQLAELARELRSRPLDVYYGLSLDQMEEIIGAPFNDSPLVRFRESLEDELFDQMSFLRLFERLIEIGLEEQGVELTATGTFRMNVIERLHEFDCVTNDRSLDHSKPPRVEADSVTLQVLRMVAETSPFFEISERRLRLDRDYLFDDGQRVPRSHVFRTLVQTLAQRLDWFDYDSFPNGLYERQFGYLLYLLHIHGGQWTSEAEYGRMVVRSYPFVTREMAKYVFRVPSEILGCIFSLRIIIPFLANFGLAETRDVPEVWWRDIRTTPLFDEVFEFDIPYPVDDLAVN